MGVRLLLRTNDTQIFGINTLQRALLHGQANVGAGTGVQRSAEDTSRATIRADFVQLPDTAEKGLNRKQGVQFRHRLTDTVHDLQHLRKRQDIPGDDSTVAQIVRLYSIANRALGGV